MSARLFLAGFLAVVSTATDACGQYDWQQGWVVPSRDPRQRRLLKERVVLYAGPAARSFVESREYGDDAALALSMCSQGVAVQLAAFHASGGLSRLPRRRDFLRLIAQPNCQDVAAVFVMQHANELADPASAELFLASPAEYVMGQSSLPHSVPQGRWATETPAYYSAPGAAPRYMYGNAGLSRQESLTLGAGLLAALGVYIWQKRRRQYRELPA
jgi:hypothetical protein